MALSESVAVPVHHPGAAQTAAMRRDTHVAGARLLRTAFAGAALRHETNGLDNAVRQEADLSFLVFGGGSDHFVYHRVDVASTNRVVLTPTVSKWSRIAQVRPTDHKTVVATPSGPVDVHAVVERGFNGTWKVTLYSWSFPAGSGP